MKSRRVAFVLGVLVLATAIGCQIVADLQNRPTDPIPPKGCTLPSTGNGRIRLVNVANVGGNTDFCFRTSGTSDWGRPVFRDGGQDHFCLSGLAYEQVTVPFNVPAGTIDVKAIPPQQDCTVKGTSEVDGVAVGDSVNHGAPVVTIVRYAGGSSPEAMSGLPEETGTANKVGQGSSYYRFVNALSGKKPINVGIAPGAMSLPTTVSAFIFPRPIAPGGVEPAGTATLGQTQALIDSSGYLSAPAASVPYAASYAQDAMNNAIALFNPGMMNSITSLYVFGDSKNVNFPVRGLYCNEGVVGTDAGAGLSAADAALLAPCVLTDPPLLSIDTFNVDLYGANAPYEHDRDQGAIPTAISARTSDFMCILEADDISDRNAIAQAAGSQFPYQFPYSYMVTTDLTTNPTKPADVQPIPATPPCAGVDISKVIGCVNANCSTVPNDPKMSGTLNQSTSCLANACVQPIFPIYGTACLNCIVYYLTSLQPISAANTACTQDDHTPFAYLGQTPSMILSHHPFVDGGSQNAAYILPSTGFRRAVLKAQVQLEDGKTKLDFFCAHLSSPGLNGLLPYTGAYGGDAGGNKWENEQDLQVKEVVDWIQQEAKRDQVPAIIAGDFQTTVGCGFGDAGSGPTCPDGGLAAESPEVTAALTGAFTRADPLNYVHLCDQCPSPTNVYNSTTQAPFENTPTFIYNPQGSPYSLPSGSVKEESLWGTSNTAVGIKGNQYEPAPPGNTGPLSATFPRNVVVLRPQ